MIKKAGIAQLVEQWIENPRVTSSNLVPGIKSKTLHKYLTHFFDIIIVRISTKNNFIVIF